MVIAFHSQGLGAKMSIEELETQVLQLGTKERAEFARRILLSLEPDLDEDTETIWAEEAERRFQQLKSGEVEAIPSEDVFRDARLRLR